LKDTGNISNEFGIVSYRESGENHPQITPITQILKNNGLQLWDLNRRLELAIRLLKLRKSGSTKSHESNTKSFSAIS